MLPALGPGTPRPHQGFVNVHLQKYFRSRLTQITSISAAVPSPRGAARDRHGRGAGCGGRGRRCRRAALTRTAKSCGPDAPTLASRRRRQLRRRRWQTSPVTGESTKETVKTIAQGMPGDPGVTVVTNSRVFYTTREAAGALGARHSLRPLISEGGRRWQNSRGIRGEIAELWLENALFHIRIRSPDER